MRREQLQRFRRLYRRAAWLGADEILRRHLDVGPDYVLPLSLAHGVDFEQHAHPQDIHGIEPIHWSYNPDIHRRAQAYKPSLQIPHPFLLHMRRQPEVKGEGVLVIGPPPGPENDRRLFEILGPDAAADHVILIKPKSELEGSRRWWTERGFKAISSPDLGGFTYENLFSLLSRHARVVSGTFSSAVVFAAAMSRPATLLRNYWYRHYEVATLKDVWTPESERARATARIFAEAAPEQVTSHALSLLGAGLSDDPADIRARLDAEIERLKSPVHSPRKLPRPATRLLAEVALATNRPGILVEPLSSYFVGRPDLYIRDMNEISVLLNGRDESNVSLQKVKFVRGKTIPGSSVDSYSDATPAQQQEAA